MHVICIIKRKKNEPEKNALHMRELVGVRACSRVYAMLISLFHDSQWQSMACSVAISLNPNGLPMLFISICLFFQCIVYTHRSTIQMGWIQRFVWNVNKYEWKYNSSLSKTRTVDLFARGALDETLIIPWTLNTRKRGALAFTRTSVYCPTAYSSI